MFAIVVWIQEAATKEEDRARIILFSMIEKQLRKLDLKLHFIEEIARSGELEKEQVSIFLFSFRICTLPVSISIFPLFPWIFFLSSRFSFWCLFFVFFLPRIIVASSNTKKDTLRTFCFTRIVYKIRFRAWYPVTSFNGSKLSFSGFVLSVRRKNDSLTVFFDFSILCGSCHANGHIVESWLSPFYALFFSTGANTLWWRFSVDLPRRFMAFLWCIKSYEVKSGCFYEFWTWVWTRGFGYGHWWEDFRFWGLSSMSSFSFFSMTIFVFLQVKYLRDSFLSPLCMDRAFCKYILFRLPVLEPSFLSYLLFSRDWSKKRISPCEQPPLYPTAVFLWNQNGIPISS